MGSKMVEKRSKSGREVIEAIKTHGPQVAPKVESALKAHLKSGEKMPDVSLTFRLLAAHLSASVQAMDVAADAHEKELSDDKEPRARRDRHQTGLRAAVVQGRSTVESLTGAHGLTVFRLDSPVPQDGDSLVKMAKAAAAELRDSAVKSPRIIAAGATLSRGVLAESILEHVATLEAALKDVKREDREAEATLVAKDRAIAAYEDVFVSVASLVTSYFELAGETELAERVRPSSRRPGRRKQEDEEEEAPTDA